MQLYIRKTKIVRMFTICPVQTGQIIFGHIHTNGRYLKLKMEAEYMNQKKGFSKDFWLVVTGQII